MAAGQAGILEPPSFVAAGGTVYATDVFCKPSVKEKKLGLEITLLNASAADRKIQVVTEIAPAKGGAAEKTFAAKEVTVPRRQDRGPQRRGALGQRAALVGPMPPPSTRRVTKVMADGKAIDVSRRNFGFREWDWSGPQFRLNGIPWQMWGDCTYATGGKKGLEAAQAQLEEWHKSGQNLMRYWGRSLWGMTIEEELSFLDAAGMPVRLTGIFDGQGANYLNGLDNNKEMFDNWGAQLTAQIRQLRNHPSIFIWSIENEVTFINIRNLGMMDRVEPEIERVAKMAMATDPTRPAMVDGGNCLKNGSLPVNGGHYLETYWHDYPDEAYTLANAVASYTTKGLIPGFGQSSWPLLTDRPIFMGRGRTSCAAASPASSPPSAARGASPDGARRRAKARASMPRCSPKATAGGAWQPFSSGPVPTKRATSSGTPGSLVSLFCRQWNWTFGGGSKVKRDLKVFNDTRFDDPIEAAWEFSVDGKRVAGEKKTFQLAPGAHEEYSVSFDVPKAAKRTAGEFVLTCRPGRQGSLPRGQTCRPDRHQLGRQDSHRQEGPGGARPVGRSQDAPGGPQDRLHRGRLGRRHSCRRQARDRWQGRPCRPAKPRMPAG